MKDHNATAIVACTVVTLVIKGSSILLPVAPARTTLIKPVIVGATKLIPQRFYSF